MADPMPEKIMEKTREFVAFLHGDSTDDRLVATLAHAIRKLLCAKCEACCQVSPHPDHLVAHMDTFLADPEIGVPLLDLRWFLKRTIVHDTSGEAVAHLAASIPECMQYGPPCPVPGCLCELTVATEVMDSPVVA